MRNSSAELAGVQQYDVIVEMDGEKIGDMVRLRKHLYNAKEVGDMMTDESISRRQINRN